MAIQVVSAKKRIISDFDSDDEFEQQMMASAEQTITKAKEEEKLSSIRNIKNNKNCTFNIILNDATKISIPKKMKLNLI